MNELDKAIEMLKKEYEKAKDKEWIRKPLAYAIYKVWKEIDRSEKGKDQ